LAKQQTELLKEGSLHVTDDPCHMSTAKIRNRRPQVFKTLYSLSSPKAAYPRQDQYYAVTGHVKRPAPFPKLNSRSAQS
jgi:hypothetical protein